jgi:hypothetical protein
MIILFWLIQTQDKLKDTTWYILFVRIIILYFPHSWLITWFVTTLPEDMRSPIYLMGFQLLDLLFYMFVLLIEQLFNGNGRWWPVTR